MSKNVQLIVDGWSTYVVSIYENRASLCWLSVRERKPTARVRVLRATRGSRSFLL
jgi:hypothetical protein